MKKSLLSLALVAATGISAQVNAGAIAYSYLELTNVQLFNVTADRQADASDFSNLDIGASSEASATSSFGAGVVTSNPIGHDTQLACSGNCGGIVGNDPTQQLGSNNFGRSDTFGDGGFLITGLGGTSSANVWTAAEGRQDITGFTSGQSNALSSTEFAFTLDDELTFRLDFTAQGELFSQLDQDEFSAISGFSWSASIVEVFSDGTETQVFTWAPNALNQSRSVLSAGQSAYSFGPTGFSDETTLEAGNYRFTINHTSQISTRAEVSQIPEPATLLLLAAGLGMIGVSRLRKNI